MTHLVECFWRKQFLEFVLILFLELRQWTSVNSLFQILSLLMYKNTISTLGKLTAVNDLLSHAFIFWTKRETETGK